MTATLVRYAVPILLTSAGLTLLVVLAFGWVRGRRARAGRYDETHPIRRPPR